MPSLSSSKFFVCIYARDHERCIVVDDGLQDDPRVVVAAFADPRMRYVRLPVNAGTAVAR